MESDSDCSVDFKFYLAKRINNPLDSSASDIDSNDIPIRKITQTKPNPETE